jgi:hypothetical protein
MSGVMGELGMLEISTTAFSSRWALPDKDRRSFASFEPMEWRAGIKVA